jgi:hypothetical protein
MWLSSKGQIPEQILDLARMRPSVHERDRSAPFTVQRRGKRKPLGFGTCTIMYAARLRKSVIQLAAL